ncbi:MAG TPA: phosphatase PAP2 family protein [Flavitalea sp.]|nr:phosphatase PAP2 family protein [Flavitalea sp.]
MVLLADSWLNEFWDWIRPADSWLLYRINQDLQLPLLDYLALFFRETIFWTPLYLFLLVFILWNFGSKGWWWVLAVILVVALSDLISSQLIKELCWRLRPCRDPDIAGTLRFIINYCPASSSFTSSHTTTHFAQATFFYLTLRHTSSWWKLAFLWAFLIGFSQIYVGVHYPFDVLCGGLLGWLIGWAVYKLYYRQFGLLLL